MAYRQFGTKLSSELMLTCCQLGPLERIQWSLDRNTTILKAENESFDGYVLSSVII